MNFVIHWNETALSLHVFPIPIPPPTSLSTSSLQVLPEHQVRALVSCIHPGPVICFTLDSIHVSMLFSSFHKIATLFHPLYFLCVYHAMWCIVLYYIMYYSMLHKYNVLYTLHKIIYQLCYMRHHCINLSNLYVLYILHMSLHIFTLLCII